LRHARVDVVNFKPFKTIIDAIFGLTNHGVTTRRERRR
jgi:hypothetical protein